TVAEGLDRPRCWQCGLPYNPYNPDTYAGERTFGRWPFWLPGLWLAVIIGIADYAIIWGTGWMDSALFLAVTFSIGSIRGYATRPSVWAGLLLSVFAIISVTFVVACVGMHGLFCAGTLGLIFLVPALAGCGVGYLVRSYFLESAWDYRRYH